jgi:hypothetical protein
VTEAATPAPEGFVPLKRTEPIPYIVRLVMRVEASPHSPQDAVTNFVDLLVGNGLRDWVYRVEDIETGDVIGYYDGYGDEVEINTAEAAPAPQRETPTPGIVAPDSVEASASPGPASRPVEDVPLPTEQDPAEAQSDAELLALAESLNQDAPASES